MARASKSSLTVLFVVAWAAVLVTGVCLFNLYDLKAAAAAQTSQHWPAAVFSTALEQTPGVPTLLMAVHPRCPCTETSLSELQGVLAHQHARINAHLLVYQPKGYPADWAMTALVRRAQSTKGLDVVFDKGGRELSRFHARVSGEVWLYDGDGKLQFRGGITAGRGHAGRNAGISSLIALLEGGRPIVQEAPVFGCAIGSEDIAGNALDK